MHQEAITRAVDACYDALVAPETWPDALHSLARSLDAVGCMYRGLTANGILDRRLQSNSLPPLSAAPPAGSWTMP
jgi:hypothetical protein